MFICKQKVKNCPIPEPYVFLVLWARDNPKSTSASFARACADRLGWGLVMRGLGVLAGGSVTSGNEKESPHALLENKSYAAGCKV